MKKSLFFFFFLLFASIAPLFPQSLSGEWNGELTQDNKPGVFNYTVYLVQDGSQVTGTARSRNAANTQNASFEVAGQWDGKNLMLQEVKQLTPENGNWCLKHIRLALGASGSTAMLAGPWEAQGCTPGQLTLRRARQAADEVVVSKAVIPTDTSSSPFKGKWVGHLDQSDRNYGFYFEVKFNPDGTGASYINSDGSEGNATIRFKWKYNPDRALLSIQEDQILEESVPTWKWCIKTCNLFYKVEENRLTLTGDWGGHIEGFTPKTGPCADGTLYLEQPVFRQGELSEQTAEGTAPTPIAAAAYLQAQGREVDVERILEVKNKTIRIRVWDNGTVDGDVCTLFLNGDMILKNYRVTRQKNETVVTLKQPVNYIILHANSLGTITPNTIAVSVDDGTQEQTVIVSSNLKTSGAIMIREFTVK